MDVAKMLIDSSTPAGGTMSIAKTANKMYKTVKLTEKIVDNIARKRQDRKNKSHVDRVTIQVPAHAEKVITHTYRKINNTNARYWNKRSRIGEARYSCFKNWAARFIGATEGKQHVDQFTNLSILNIHDIYDDWTTQLGAVTLATVPAQKYAVGRELFLDKVITKLEIVNNTEYGQELKLFSFVAKQNMLTLDTIHDLTNPTNTWSELINKTQGNYGTTSHYTIGEMPYAIPEFSRYFKTAGYTRLFIPPGGIVVLYDNRYLKCFIDTEELKGMEDEANAQTCYGALAYITGSIMAIGRGMPAHSAAGDVSTPVANLDCYWTQYRYYGEVDKEKYPYRYLISDNLASDKVLLGAVSPDIRTVDD